MRGSPSAVRIITSPCNSEPRLLRPIRAENRVGGRIVYPNYYFTRITIHLLCILTKQTPRLNVCGCSRIRTNNGPNILQESLNKTYIICMTRVGEYWLFDVETLFFPKMIKGFFAPQIDGD